MLYCFATEVVYMILTLSSFEVSSRAQFYMCLPFECFHVIAKMFLFIWKLVALSLYFIGTEENFRTKKP